MNLSGRNSSAVPEAHAGDDFIQARAVRSLDEKLVSRTENSDQIGQNVIRSCIMRTEDAFWKNATGMGHLFFHGHQCVEIGREDRLRQTCMKVGRARPQFSHIAEERELPASSFSAGNDERARAHQAIAKGDAIRRPAFRQIAFPDPPVTCASSAFVQGIAFPVLTDPIVASIREKRPGLGQFGAMPCKS